jgi:diamine N-acetyltransferase
MLTLRPSAVGDLGDVTGWEAEPDSALWLGETGAGWHSRALADPDQDHLIAAEAEVPVGFAVLAGLSEGVNLELRRMLVRPAHRGSGRGRALLTASLEWAYQRRGAQGVWLDVKAHNQRARALYESAGFTATKTLTGVIAEPDGSRSDLIVMTHCGPS